MNRTRRRLSRKIKKQKVLPRHLELLPKHTYVLDTDEPAWASLYADSFIQISEILGDDRARLHINTGSSPIVNIIAQEFQVNDLDETVDLPVPNTEEQWEETSIQFSQKEEIRLQSILGVEYSLSTPIKITCVQYVSSVLFYLFGIDLRPKFYFPVMKPTMTHIHGLYENLDDVDCQTICTNFLSGLGIKSPNIISVSSIGLEASASLFFSDALKVAVLRTCSPLAVVARSLYIDYDHLYKAKPCISIYRESYNIRPAMDPYSPVFIYYMPDLMQPEIATEMGKKWKVREMFNHNAIAWLKATALSNKERR